MPLHGNLRAIAAMIAACAMFGCMDAVLKALAGTYPPLQVTALRGLTAMPLVCLYVLWRGQMGAVFGRRLRWRLHLLRGVISVAMMALFTFGLKTLGLAEAYTLTFVAPMIITMLSVPMLKETVPPRHWAAIAVGLCGVVVALRPDQSAFLSVGALAVLAAALCYALSNVVGPHHQPHRTERDAGVLDHRRDGAGRRRAQRAAVGRHPARALAAAGRLAVSGFLGQLAITEAFRHGQASAVAPFEYTALAWAVVLDWVFWRAVPDAYTLAGGAIIIASGIYLIRREAPREMVVVPP